MTITHRANGRAWGDGENREHYSNQLSGQVVEKLEVGEHNLPSGVLNI